MYLQSRLPILKKSCPHLFFLVAQPFQLRLLFALLSATLRIVRRSENG
jgi:hypothetical protein